jgi:hypothetical protein
MTVGKLAKPKRRISYFHAFSFGCFVSSLLIGMEYISDGGQDWRAWTGAKLDESIPYYVARLGIVGLVFMIVPAVVNWDRQPR